MAFSLKRFLAKRLGMDDKAKYQQADEKTTTLVNTIIVLGGDMGGAVQVLCDGCNLLSERWASACIVLGCSHIDDVAEAIDEGISTEAGHLVNDDTLIADDRSVATMRLPSSSSLLASSDGNGEREATELPLILCFPNLRGDHAARVCESTHHCKLVTTNILGTVAVAAPRHPATSTAVEVEHSSQAPQHFVVRAPQQVLSVYESLRKATAMLVTSTQAAGGSVVTVDTEMTYQVEAWDGERSASWRRLKLCRGGALTALQIILTNLIQSEGREERFRVLVTTSQKWCETFGKSENATAVLRNCGFTSVDAQGNRVRATNSQGTNGWCGAVEEEEVTPSSLCNRMVMTEENVCSGLPELRRTLHDVLDELHRREQLQGQGGLKQSKQQQHTEWTSKKR